MGWHRGARRRPPRGLPGGRRDPHGADRAARYAHDRLEPRVRGRGQRGRPARDAARGRVPRARVDHPGGSPVRRPRGTDRARVVRAVARGRRRHGDPRVHPLSGHQPAAAAAARSACDARQLRSRASAPGRAHPLHARDREPARGRRRLPLSLHRRRRCVPRARHPLSADAARRNRARRARGARPARLTERSYARAPDALRPTTIEPGFVRTATGSALISVGETRVICTASAEESVPRWMAGRGDGWGTAEYGMLPASTGARKQRDATRGRQDGRTVEIQRLIGRSLRGVVDFRALGERTMYLDCDVLQADGGTRCASITGAYVALSLACARLQAEGLLEPEGSPLRGSVAAVSCGMIDGAALLDLDYPEDSTAEVDANVVMTGEGGLIEVQATAERTPLSRAHLDELLALAAAGIDRLRADQEQAIAAG